MKPVLIAALLLSLGTLAPARAADQPAMAAAQPTCGQMTASMAAIPEKLAMGALSVAEMEEAHAKFLSSNKDKASQAEVKGLRDLAKAHKQVAASIEKVAAQMKQAASWPAAPHDMAKMKADPALAAAGKKVLDAHKEIIAEMQKMVAQMEKQMQMK
jgi:endonuclease/exonuclease/phosphatase (EEP) superfamily protein YafD